MKKIIAMMAMLAVAGVAHAYYWNVAWAITAAYNPSDLDADTNPTLLQDYSVTWSLVYGDAVTVDDQGQLVGATEIDSMYAPKGSSGMSWSFEDSEGYKTSGSYNAFLHSTGTATYLGEVTEATTQKVYQYIFIDGGSPGDQYYWLSEGVDVTPTLSTQVAPVDLGKTIELGSKDDISGYVNAQWTQIPEPATMSLLGLGALALALRRKLRK